MKRIGMTLAMLWISAGMAHASSVSGEILGLADAYGFGHWDNVEVLQFTFHIQEGTTTTERAWEWNVKTNAVTLQTTRGGNPIRVTYMRGALDQGDRALNEQADRWFAYDQNWLLFPLHLVWDEDTAQISLAGEEPLPMGKGRAVKATVAYPAEGSDNPGDVYEVFYGPVHGATDALTRPSDSARWDNSPFIFRQWRLRKAGSPKAAFVTTWDGYERLGPLIIATEHHDRSGKFRVWFSDLGIKETGDATWKTPSPVDTPKKR
jgi:hypothetical protein